MSNSVAYDGGVQRHMTTPELHAYMAQLVESNSLLPMAEQQEMSDAAAQTVAAQWVSPANPRSVALATRGQVIEGTTMGDFASMAEYSAQDAMGKLCLDYLMTYTLRKELGE